MQFFKFAFALSCATLVMAETCFPPGQSCQVEPANCCSGRCEPSDGDFLVSKPQSNVSCELKVVFVSVHSIMIGLSLVEHIMI
ncbi:hypothetical protein PILCRDRAFT_816196 [Piloderma croceum F 1598]|uniref:Uncharacterized protein n=1 Tax=Piloderma croceum (strain F 1598) TaxID=765440 RepID=A0A0C3G322_PILCF|nr:hypothetical protein PILCRDRAFT_816196 [Piloderma croceum F 1598]